MVFVRKMENQFWFMTDDSSGIHYDRIRKRWVPRKEYNGNCWPGEFPCRSYRAAKRHLKYHSEIPKGTALRLVSRFVGFDRYLVKK